MDPTSKTIVELVDAVRGLRAALELVESTSSELYFDPSWCDLSRLTPEKWGEIKKAIAKIHNEASQAISRFNPERPVD